jgi:hypothetical protein
MLEVTGESSQERTMNRTEGETGIQALAPSW